MPAPALFRLAGLAGLLTAVLLLLNDLRRVGLVPENAVSESIAPLPAVLALFALTGLYLWQRTETGVLGLVGYALNTAGVAGLLIAEFTSHYLFSGLSDAEIEDLVAGRPRAGFLGIAAIFAVGVTVFAIASWRSGRYPRWAIALYLIGFLLAAGRSAAPDAVVSLGFLLGAAGVGGLCLTLWRNAAASATEPAGGLATAHH